MFQNNPKVYIGGRELLTHALTSGEVINWLVGPSGTLSEYGYVPINENGIIDEQYLGKFGIDIYKDGDNGLVLTDAKSLDFSGEYIQSIVAEGDKVKIRIGKPVGGSHFNSTDGEKSGTVIHNMNLTPMIIPDCKYDSDLGKELFGNWTKEYEKYDDILTYQDKDKFIIKKRI